MKKRYVAQVNRGIEVLCDDADKLKHLLRGFDKVRLPKKGILGD